MNWLLMDSCGGTAVLALCCDEAVVARVDVVGREFSAEWTEALRGLLREAGWKLAEVEMVGVVRGPGSFTGMRVGLAAAKGLCEATGAKMIAVSRLEMLAALAGTDAVAVLDAGRGEFYVREGSADSLMCREELAGVATGREVVAAEENVGVALTGVRVTLVELDAKAAIPQVMKRWREGAGDDVASVDANYVRGEHAIYAKRTEVAGGRSR